jgi:hypothetical protein
MLFQQIEHAFESGTPFDAAAFERSVITFEDAWTHDTSPMAIQPIGDPVSMSRQLFAQCQPLWSEKSEGAMTAS